MFQKGTLKCQVQFLIFSKVLTALILYELQRSMVVKALANL